MQVINRFAFQTPVRVIEPNPNRRTMESVWVTTKIIGHGGPVTTAAGSTTTNRVPTPSLQFPHL